MIKSFGDNETEKVWQGRVSRKRPIQIQQIVRRKLRMLNNSMNLGDLRVPPANRLEKLKGKLKGHYSIRVNDKWRLVFKWQNGHSYEVELTDYHE